MAKNNKDGIVFSTGNTHSWDDEDDNTQEEIAPGKQNLRIHLERYKGGKVATVIREYRGPEDTLESLGKSLKMKCGCGGSVKDGEIILQGDFRTKVKAELEKLGYKCKLAGG